MAVYDIIPSVFTGDDVRDTLNAYGGTVADNWLEYFTTKANINPMSKYKPVRFTGDFPSRDAYYKANNGLMGFAVSSYSSYTQIVDAMDGGMNGWVYELPRGGAYNEPFRMDDFIGYCPKADPIIAEQYQPETCAKGDKFYVEAAVTQQGTTGIEFADFPFLSGYYFGVYIVGQSSGMSQWVVTDDMSVGTNLISVEVDTTNWATGKYKIYPFLSASKISLTNSYTAANTYYTIPLMQVAEIEITATDTNAPYISVEAWMAEGSTTTVKYNFSILNGTAGTKVTNLVVKIRRYDKAYTDDMLTYEYQTTLLEVTLGSNGTYSSGELSATINSQLYDYGAVCYVYGVYANGNQAMLGKAEVAVEQPE